MERRKKGISLLVLIITIVVIIILAAAVILTLNKNNPIGSAKEAQFKNDLKSMAESAQINLLTAYITDDTIMSKTIVKPEIYDYVPELENSKYRAYISKGQLTISSDKGEYGGYSDEQIKWARDIHILVQNPPEIAGITLTAQDTQITATLQGANIDTNTKSYMYRIIGPCQSGEWVTTTSSTHAFTDLCLGSNYIIEAKTIVVATGVMTDAITNSISTTGAAENVTISSKTAPTSDKATVTLTYNNIPTGYRLQYKTGKNGSWTDYTQPFDVLENESISGRLYKDGGAEDVAIATHDIANIDIESPTKPTEISVVSKTANSITVKAIGSIDLASGLAGYIYSQDNTTWSDVIPATTAYTINNIKSNTPVTIYAKAVDNVNRQSDAISITVNTTAITEIQISGIPTVWQNTSASITLSHSNIPSGYVIQYKLGTSVDWITYTAGSTITIAENTLITARLYNSALSDATIESAHNITNIDKVAPNAATITLPTTSSSKEFTANVVVSDALSGVNKNQSKYFLTTNNSPLATNASQWNSAPALTGLNAAVRLTNVSDGTYYLQILTTDNAGNKIVTVSSNNVVVKEVVYPDITTSVAPPDGTLHTDPQPRPNSAPVPNGFVVSSLPTENTVDQGLVIKQGSDPASTTSNEFVWIPVPDISQMYDEATNRSKLYDFQAGRKSTLQSDCLTTTSGYREPDVVSQYDGNSTYLQQAGLPSTATINDFKTELTTSYNKMIASVKKYNGYYIARYEAGDLSKPVIVSKKNNADIGSQTWYTIYKKAKEMISNTHVQSSIIWDGQWDASLRWMNSYSDTGNSVTDTVKGNFSGSRIPTGSNENYKFKNIYDMTGNVNDWNLGTYSTSDRVIRGGRFDFGLPVSFRSSNDPNYSYDSYGARLTLYINL